MTSKELISNLALLGPQRMPVFLEYIADHLHQARLADGQRLNDAIDFAAWLREIAGRAEPAADNVGKLLLANAEAGNGTRPAVTADFCPRCGHAAHHGRTCEEKTGGERVCLCEY